MTRSIMVILICVVIVVCALQTTTAQAQTPQAYGRQWAGSYNTQDWNRFYHYPYVYYPQNFWSPDYYRSSQDLVNRYPAEMRVPVYNTRWQNYYPVPRKYHWGHHYIMDVF